jgi:hypothetical protein
MTNVKLLAKNSSWVEKILGGHLSLHVTPMGHEAGLNGAMKSRPHLGSNPACPARTESLYRLRYATIVNVISALLWRNIIIYNYMQPVGRGGMPQSV